MRHLTQPAVSLQLKALEEATGLQLSTGRPEAGAALLPLAHKAVSAALDFRAAADALKQSQCSTLRVGTILDPEFIRLGPFVGSLTASSQNIEMFLRHGMSDDVLTQIGRGELDVGYCIDATSDPAPPPRLPSERSIDGCKFQLAPLLSYTSRVVAPAERSDKVLGKGWADLAALPWLATPSPSAHRRLLDDVFRPFGPLPKRVGFTDQEEAMIGFVESGVCLSLARDGVLERITRQRDFVIADKVSLACNLSFGCHATPGAGDFAGLCGDAHGVRSEHRQSPRRVDAHGELMTAIDGPIRTSRQDRRSIQRFIPGTSGTAEHSPAGPPRSSRSNDFYADFSNSSRPISMRRISLVPAPIS